MVKRFRVSIPRNGPGASTAPVDGATLDGPGDAALGGHPGPQRYRPSTGLLAAAQVKVNELAGFVDD